MRNRTARVVDQIVGGFVKVSDREGIKLESNSAINLLRASNMLENTGFDVEVHETSLGWIAKVSLKLRSSIRMCAYLGVPPPRVRTSEHLSSGIRIHPI